MIKEFALQNREDQTRRKLTSAYLDIRKISEFFSNRTDDSQAIVIMDNGNKYYTEENVKTIRKLFS